ncbi:hypothetical protein OHB26_08360 [Nocardia sp. NBC_01503]|uniref:hypothetical protein n=1 Tax=Nocardia sp. NBC_01503 TaxID=2975997 RepID=UPI002E7C03BC|nr:hypothetical protein [Nocardia sp. NBC_01503]WTL34203.1 hypothetical protein OHB26_08360 [Nocardia sp. NBC_01503]
MTAVWLPFLLGLTAGSLLVWLTTQLSTQHRPPAAEGWTVAAITSRLENERRQLPPKPIASKPAVAERLW